MLTIKSQAGSRGGQTPKRQKRASEKRMGGGKYLAREILHSGVFLTIQRYLRTIRQALSQYEICMNLRAGHKKAGVIRWNPPAWCGLGKLRERLRRAFL